MCVTALTVSFTGTGCPVLVLSSSRFCSGLILTMLFPGPDSVLSPDWLYPVPVTILSSFRSPYFVLPRPAFVLPYLDSILVLFQPGSALSWPQYGL